MTDAKNPHAFNAVAATWLWAGCSHPAGVAG